MSYTRAHAHTYTCFQRHATTSLTPPDLALASTYIRTQPPQLLPTPPPVVHPVPPLPVGHLLRFGRRLAQLHRLPLPLLLGHLRLWSQSGTHRGTVKLAASHPSHPDGYRQRCEWRRLPRHQTWGVGPCERAAFNGKTALSKALRIPVDHRSLSLSPQATVSIVTIVVRREFFKRRFRKMIETDARARKRARDVEAADRDNKRFHRVLHPFAFGPSEKALEGAPPHSRGSSSPGDDTLLPTSQMQKKSKMDRLRPDMIKRVDSPVRVNQMSIGGNLDQGTNIPVRSSLEPDMPHDPAQESAAGVRLELAVDGEESDGSLSDLKRTSDGIEDQGARHGRGHARRSSDPSLPTAPGKGKDKIFKRVRTLDPPKSTDASSPIASPLPRTQTIEIREPPHPVHYRREQGTSSAVPGYGGGDTLRRRATTASLERSESVSSSMFHPPL